MKKMTATTMRMMVRRRRRRIGFPCTSSCLVSW
jgi:hypothetical protein